MGALGCLGIEAQAKKLSVEVVDGCAGERRFREPGAALGHQHDVPVADEIGSDKLVDLPGGDIARPAGEIDDGIGSLLRRACRVCRDEEPNGATGRLAAIFRDDEVAAACVGERLGALQLRAWRGSKRGTLLSASAGTAVATKKSVRNKERWPNMSGLPGATL